MRMKGGYRLYGMEDWLVDRVQRKVEGECSLDMFERLDNRLRRTTV